MLNFLEVEGPHQSDKLVFGIFQLVVDQFVREEDGLVCELHLVDCRSDPNLELLLRLNSVSNSLAQLFERWWIDEEEVAFKCFLVNLQSTLHIDLKNGNLILALNALYLRVGRPIPDATALFALSILNECIVVRHFDELSLTHEDEVLLRFFVVFTHGTRRVRLLACENVTEVGEDHVDEGTLAHAGGTHEDERLVLLWLRVKWMEVLFSVDENIILL